MIHSFDRDIAVKYGLHEAIVLECIGFWVDQNRANDKNHHDGCYWTYNSVKAYQETFPYLSPKQIRTTLNNLEAKGLVITGNYNKEPWDRTKWYSLSSLGEAICHLGQTPLPCKATPCALEGKPIPVNNQLVTNIPPIVPQGDLPPTPNSEDTFSQFWDAYPRKAGKAESKKKWMKLKPDEELLKHILYAIKKQSESEQWQEQGGKFIPMASTWLNQRRWEDTPPPPKPIKITVVQHGEWNPLDALTGDLYSYKEEK